MSEKSEGGMVKGQSLEGVHPGFEAHDSNTEVPQESMEAFKQRVEDRTGMKFDEIQKGEQNDLIGSHIMVKRDNLYVIGVDQYPEEDPQTGEQTYKEFKIVDLRNEVRR